MSEFKFFRLLLLALLLTFCRQTVFAQETEEQLKTKAAELFEQEKYVEATSCYLRLLALSPRAHEYNFRYGTCLLYNSYKKQDAFRYLNYSVSDPGIDAQAFYFLGKAYHLNYQFNDAIRNYDLYKQKSGGRPKTAFEVDRQIEMCQNGKRLLTTITDIIVLEKKEFDKKEFFRLYNLNNIGGDLVVAAAYQSRIDKKKGHVPLVHLGANAKTFFYSSYGDQDTGQKDIYMRRKLPDNSWGLPQLVRGNVNTKYDEDFPYMHPGGEYLYFSSRGHNSMGGYDIFRSRLNAETGTFGPPENMDFAVSSPDDDMFYVVDSLDNNAYFASSRQSSNGKVFVYKVRVERVPLQLAVIKGSFSSAINPEAKKLSIVVTDFSSGEKIGTFITNEKSSYLITLPKGGKYKYEMKVEGKEAVHTYVVNVPFFKEFHPLKQKIVEEKAESGDVVRVIDQFSEAVDDPVGVLAEVIKLRSELNPNADQFDLKSLDADKENQRILAELGFGEASPQEIVGQFNRLTDKQKELVQNAENLVNGGLTNASSKLQEAAKLQEQARTKVNQANSLTDKQEKFETLKEAQLLAKKAGELKKEAKELITFADSISKTLPSEQLQLSAIESVTKEISTAVADDNISDLKDIIGRNTALIADASSSKPDASAKLLEEKRNIDKQQIETENQRANYAASAQRLTSEIHQLTTSMASARTKDQSAIQTSINDKQQELKLVQEERDYQEKKIEKLALAEKAIDEKMNFLNSVVSVTDGPKTDRSAVQTRLTEVDSKNNNTLANYINQQVEILEKDPEIQKAPADSDLAALTNRSGDIAELDASQSTDPVEKKRKLAELDAALISDLDAGIAETDDLLLREPQNTAAAEKKKALNKLKNEALNNQQRHQSAEIPVNIAATSPEKELSLLAPSYETELSAVQGDEGTKLAAQNTIDLQLTEKIDKEISRMNDLLASDPSDKQASDKRTALTELRAKTQQQITDRSAKIGELKAASSVVSVTPESELKAIAPDYNEQLNAVSGDEKDKLAAQNKIDEKVILLIDTELKTVEAALEENPADTEAQQRKTALSELRASKVSALSQREENIKQLDIASNPAITPASEKEKLSPDYQVRMAAATAGNRAEQLTAQNSIDEDLIVKIDEELAEIDGQILRNPSNAEAQARQTALNQLKQDAENAIEQRSREIDDLTASQETGETSAKSVIASARPGYETNIQKITAKYPEGEKRESAILKEEELLLKDLSAAVTELEAQVAKDPENTGLRAQLNSAREITAIQEAKVDEKQLELVASEVGKLDKQAVLKNIAPKFVVSEAGSNGSSIAVEEALASEAGLQAALGKKHASNEKQLSKGFNATVAAENKVIEELKLESEERVKQLNNPAGQNQEAVAAINNDLGDDAELLMRSQPETIEEAKRIITELKEYENQLDEQLTELRSEDPQDGQLISVKDQQLSAVRKRIGIVEGDLDAMENFVVPVTQAVEAETELSLLNSREEELIQRQSRTGLTKTEQRVLDKELKQVREQKSKQEIKVLAVKTENTEQSLAAESSRLAASSGENPLAGSVLAITGTTADSKASRSPDNKSVSDDLQKKQENLTLISAAADYIQTEKEYREQSVVTESADQLQAKKRRFLIEIGQLESIAGPLRNDPSKASELQQIENQRNELNKAVEKIDGMTEELREKDQVVNILLSGLDESLSYEDEVAIAGKEQYAALLRQQGEVRETTEQLTELIREKEAIRTGISQETEPGKRPALVSALVRMESEQKVLEEQLNDQQAAMESAIIRSGIEPEKAKNMLARGVPYKAPVSAAAILTPEMRTGFQMVANPAEVRKAKLPVGLKAPSGLVYRVQVGAYAKALPEHLFTEFTPVTGEKLNNGITRYMAGYFGNRQRSLEAQRAIRSLGYSDAFIVAYCDGERISIAEARRLEAAGLCIARNQDSLMIEVVENTLSTMAPDSLLKLRPVVKPSDYNKAPGAAPAEAVEERQGLFFTVQVGAYNRPATMEQLRNIQPLITKRLPNGQIRYSTGIFRTADAAKPKRTEAITRGIPDAFIAAYYKGERISLADARQLLEERGEEVLERDSITVLKPEVFEEARIYAADQPIAESATTKQPVQIVSSRTFEQYPARELSSFNNYGTFYFDVTDKRIKSIVYSSVSALPQLQNLQESVDTLFRNSQNGSNFEPKLPSVVAEWGSSELSGAFGDWLIRTSLKHAGVKTGEGYRIAFEDVEPQKREELIAILQQFGATLVSLGEEQK